MQTPAAQNSAMTRIHAWALALACLFLLSGCWGGDANTTQAPQESVTSRFIAGTPSHIETVIVDPLPVASAHLVTADGVMIEAKEIVREKNSYADEGGNLPHVSVGAAGGSQTRVTTGIGIEFPLFGGGTDSRAISTTTSTITFMVPDRLVYEESWQRWLLHVELGDGASHRTIETLPPKPPME